MLAAIAVNDVPRQRPPDPPEDDHRSLMLRVAERRDRDAFKRLFLHFGPRIKAFMLKSGADGAQAEDLVQDVMMTVWRKVEFYSPERGSVSAWIFTIARNARIDRLRSASSRPYEDVESLELASEAPSGEDTALAQQASERVKIALSSLPGDQREIIELGFLHDMSQSGIAERLNIPLGTVKSRMRLAYAKLRGQLEDFQ